MINLKLLFLVIFCHSVVSRWISIEDELRYYRHMMNNIAIDIISQYNNDKLFENRLSFNSIKKGDKWLDFPFIKYRLILNVKDVNGTLKLYEAKRSWEVDDTNLDFPHPNVGSFKLSFR